MVVLKVLNMLLTHTPHTLTRTPHISPSHTLSHPHPLTAEFYKLKDELPDAYKNKDVKPETKEQPPAASSEKVVTIRSVSLLSVVSELTYPCSQWCES